MAATRKGHRFMSIDSHDLEAEKATLGAMLTNQRAVDEVDAHVNAADYYQPRHETIYATILDLHAHGLPTDPIAVTDALTRSGELDRVGGAAYLYDLTGSITTTANADYYAALVAKQATRRNLAQTGLRLMQMADQSEQSVLVEDAYRILEDGLSTKTAADVTFVADILPDLYDSLAETGTPLFHATPWESLNDVIGGFRPGGLYVVAARPAQGKTIVGAQIAVALSQHGNVAFSNLEMSRSELVARMVSEQLAIMVGKLKDRRLTPRDWDILNAGRLKLAELRIAIDDRPGVTVHDIRQHARAVSRKPGGLSGIVIDYLQLMSSSDKRPREQQVAEFSRAAKVMAKELGVPVILLSQLNRKVEEREGGLPKLSDLRESGSIEQDADVVMLLRRSDERFVIHVAKNRHGEEREVELVWQGEFSRVVEHDWY